MFVLAIANFVAYLTHVVSLFHAVESFVVIAVIAAFTRTDALFVRLM